jgi:D-glutamate cyclase
MTTDEKLAAILAAVQTDPGNRGLARDPHDNLFTATKGDFEAACRSIASRAELSVQVVTGFYIATADPPCGETDGPLGAVFLARAFHHLAGNVWLHADPFCAEALDRGVIASGIDERFIVRNEKPNSEGSLAGFWVKSPDGWAPINCAIAVERVGPASDKRCYTMRGRDITANMLPAHHLFQFSAGQPTLWQTIGIGDGGNEIGMGKIPHETIVKNIPNGDLIHCRVPTDHLIVTGVSNWGAYALTAGVYVLRGVKPPGDLFDPHRERAILEVMVREGPLVDGVTGKQTATVDGLSWDEYAKPLVRIREILES